MRGSRPRPTCSKAARPGLFRSRPRAAFSLLEVVAATVLLGLLASGLVLASARLRKQEAFMRNKLQAVELADRLLASNTRSSGSDGEFSWTFTQEPAPALLGTGVAQYRLAVFRTADPDRRELTSVSFTRAEKEGP